MVTTECDFAELRRAYQILGVPQSASERSIKQAYRQIAKRWHPDLYASGTPAHNEATQMMKLINEAYSRIEDAPLRQRAETSPADAPRRTQPQPYSEWELRKLNLDELLVADRFGFWVRFLFGTCFGALISFRFLVSFLDSPTVLIATVCVVFGFAFGSAKYGDRFWDKILGGSGRW